MDEPTPQSTEPQTFDQSPQVGLVEMDRYCANCGYNLRQQAVRREPVTGLLLCKCPECGSFEPANQAITRPRSWFAQLVFLLWLAWFAVLGLAMAGSISAVATLSHELGVVVHETQKLDPPITNEDGTTRYSQYQLSVMEGEKLTELLKRVGASFSVAAGFVTLMLLFVPHWKKRSYFLLAMVWPIIALIVFYGTRGFESYLLQNATSGLRTWIFLCPLLIALFAQAGGLLALIFSRPLARLIICVLVPARHRGPFAYLWLVDGKQPTGTVRT